MQKEIEQVIEDCEFDAIFIADELADRPYKDELTRLAYEYEMDYTDACKFLEIFRNIEEKDLVEFAEKLRQAAIDLGFGYAD